MIGVLAVIGITTIFLWVTIYFVAGINHHSWSEIFIYVLFFTLIGTANRFLQIFSSESGFILIVTIVSALIIGIMLYFLLDFRIGILEKKKKLTIVSIFIGVKLVFSLLFKSTL